MPNRYPESDWKTYREVNVLAIDRYCNRALVEVSRILTDEARAASERLDAIDRLTRDRSKTLHRDFTILSRSRMFLQLAAMHAHGLLEPEDIARVSPGLQSDLRRIVDPDR